MWEGYITAHKTMAPSWSRLRRNSRHLGPGTQSYCWKDSFIPTVVVMLDLAPEHAKVHAPVSSRVGPGLAHHVPTKNIWESSSSGSGPQASSSGEQRERRLSVC